MESSKKEIAIFFRVTQDFMWQNMKQVPGLFGVIDQRNLPPPFPPDKPKPPDLMVA